MLGDSNNESNLSHKLFLTNIQVLVIYTAFANNTPSDIKFFKNQLSKMVQLGEFLGRWLGPLLKTGIPLTKSVIEPLAKSVLIPLKLTAVASAADSVTIKKY